MLWDNGKTKSIIPRSIVQFLESQIASKELQLRDRGIAYDEDDVMKSVESVHKTPPPRHISTTDDPADLGRAARREEILALATGGVKQMPSTTIRGGVGFPSELFLLSSSRLPQYQSMSLETGDTDDVQRHRSQIYNSHQGTSPQSLPLSVATLLTKHYVESILPRYPFINPDNLWDKFNHVYNPRASETSPPPGFSNFVVSMVLCISIMTSRASDSRKIVSTSDKIFRNALRYFDCLRSTSILTIQGCLLLIQYVSIRPEVGNISDLIGLTMRMAIELGLHQDHAVNIQLNGQELDEENKSLRRRIFWVIYEESVNVCATCHRRPFISDHLISVRFPSQSDMASIRQATLPNTPRVKGHFLNVLRYRQLQSEIFSVNFACEDAPGFNMATSDSSYRAWMKDIEGRISAWHNSIAREHSTGPEYFKVSCGHGIVFLHRPCPRNPCPSPASLVKCFDAALQVAAHCLEYSNSGFLRHPWHSALHSFEAAISMLYAIKNCELELKERYGMKRILEGVHQFSSLFVLLSMAWSTASRLRDTYERLKNSILKRLTGQSNNKITEDNNELDKLILPTLIRRASFLQPSNTADIQEVITNEAPRQVYNDLAPPMISHDIIRDLFSNQRPYMGNDSHFQTTSRSSVPALVTNPTSSSGESLAEVMSFSTSSRDPTLVQNNRDPNRDLACSDFMNEESLGIEWDELDWSQDMSDFIL